LIMGSPWIRARGMLHPVGDVGSIFESGAPLAIGLWDYVLRSPPLLSNFSAQPTLAAAATSHQVMSLCYVASVHSLDTAIGAGTPAQPAKDWR